MKGGTGVILGIDFAAAIAAITFAKLYSTLELDGFLTLVGITVALAILVGALVWRGQNPQTTNQT